MAASVDRPADGSDTTTLVDHTEVFVRPIATGDAAALVRFHHLLSRRSTTQRYFYPHPDLSSDEVAHLTRVDGEGRVALVVEQGGELIAVGRYERLADATAAEVAFVVADAYQFHGIATLLLHRLAQMATAVGITRFIAEVLVENRAMLRVFEGSGFPVESTSRWGTVEVTMAIVPVGCPA